MDLLSKIDLTMKALIAVATLTGILFGFLRWVRPQMKRAAADTAAVRDAILGREAVRDSITGRELAPELPGIGVRMATVENAIATLVDQHTRIEGLERRVTVLENTSSQTVVQQTFNGGQSPGLGEN